MSIKFGPRRLPSRRSIRTRWLAFALGLLALAIPALALASHQFTDVPTTHRFHDDIDAIADAGVTLGCGGGKYCPDKVVTRAQMAAFLNRLGALAEGTTPVVNADRVDGLDSTAFMPAATYIIIEEATVLAGDTNGFNVSCDDGDRILSGGLFDVQLLTHVTDNYPFDTDTWEVFLLNTGLVDDDLSLHVLCADFAPMHEE